jgi:hypothetical protein
MKPRRARRTRSICFGLLRELRVFVLKQRYLTIRFAAERDFDQCKIVAIHYAIAVGIARENRISHIALNHSKLNNHPLAGGCLVPQQFAVISIGRFQFERLYDLPASRPKLERDGLRLARQSCDGLLCFAHNGEAGDREISLMPWTSSWLDKPEGVEHHSAVAINQGRIIAGALDRNSPVAGLRRIDRVNFCRACRRRDRRLHDSRIIGGDYAAVRADY